MEPPLGDGAPARSAQDAVAPRQAVGEYQRKGGGRKAAGNTRTKGMRHRSTALAANSALRMNRIAA
jgi:hypothetical protein